MDKNQIFALLLDNIKEELNEQGKAKFNKWMNKEAIPMIKQAADDITAKLNVQSKNESGWCAARDRIVYPTLIEITLWVLSVSFKKIAELDNIQKVQ